ncbi:hypothetical protein, partial [Chryseobacterium sp. AG844]|uniref:hypothetical protein n=1 Tax=Chryseobacterium sp. AG844 TaxID=2183998 RepID=UPI001E4EFFDA
KHNILPELFSQNCSLTPFALYVNLFFCKHRSQNLKKSIKQPSVEIRVICGKKTIKTTNCHNTKSFPTFVKNKS